MTKIRLERGEKIVLVLVGILVILVINPMIILTPMFSLSESYVVNADSPASLSTRLEAGDEVVIDIKIGNSSEPLNVFVNRYSSKPRLSSDFNPVQTYTFPVYANRNVTEDLTVNIKAKREGIYAVEVYSNSFLDTDVTINIIPINLPNWIFRIRLVMGILAVLGILYVFGKYL